jgi:hypothetical protein
VTKLPATIYPALQKFVMKGVTTKAAARDAHTELGELIESLETLRDDMDNHLCDWEDGDDAETRADARANLEQVVNDIDDPLSQAGFCTGQKPYEPEL